MALPKIDHPLFDLTIPSTQQKVKMRPMLVKEEKIILIAKEAKEENDIMNAIKQIVQNCIIDNVDVEKLSLFDIQYIFIKIRSISVNNIAKITVKDSEDEKEYTLEVDLNTVEVKFNPDSKKNITVNPTTSIVMKYPEASLYSIDNVWNSDNENVILDNLISYSIDKVFVNDAVTDFQLCTPEEKKEFIESLDMKTYDQMRAFIFTLPTISHVVKYTNSKGTEREIVLSTIRDFFTF